MRVRKRQDGRWEGRLQIGRRRVSVYGRTRAEAEVRLARLRWGAVAPPRHGPRTVADLIWRWVETDGAAWRPSTRAKYAQLLQRWVLPYLGPVPLRRLGPDAVQVLLARIPGRARSQTWRLLHRLFVVAERWGFVAANPLRHLVPPAYRPEPRALPPLEAVRARLHQAREDAWWPWVALAISTGLRPGEQAALRWDDVDITRGVLHVRRAGQYVGGAWVEGPPKTSAGARVVHLSPLGVRALQRQRQASGGGGGGPAVGAAGAGGGLVFPGRRGQPLQASVINRHTRRLLGLSAHQLRHLHASLALQAGVAVPVVARRLGHASPSITLQIYAHAVGPDAHAAQAVEQLLA